MKKLSVIIPFFNEQECIERIYEELKAVRSSRLAHYAFEVIFMDNHSTDDSYAIVSKICARDPECKVFRLSRNFGFQANVLTGYLNSTGDAAVQLDADGEDDPQIIPHFVELWEQGYQVVYGVRKTRAESFLLSLQRKIFYRILNSISDFPIPLDAGDFRLIDRKVVKALSEFKEANPYIRGLISYAGFKQVGFSYDRRPRYRGVSKFTWFDYLNLAWTGITSFSSKPLEIATWIGLTFAGLSFLGTLFYLGLYFTGHIPVRGFTTLVLIQLFIAGVQLLCIGLLGKYLGFIFKEVKSRPLSIVEKSIPEKSE